jgi:hypothetical protein
VRKIVMVVILGVLLGPNAFSQKRSRPEQQPQQTKRKVVRVFDRRTISVRYGIGIPLSNKGITAFWAPGSSVSAEFLIDINSRLSLGLGIDAAKFSFREEWFRLGYPTLPIHALDLYWWNVYVGGKFAIPNRSLFTPFGEAQIGVSHITPAEYREVINGVRVTYYNIKSSTRLTLGLSAGVDVRVAWWLALQAEGKMTYAYNDPQRNFVFLGRGGFLFSIY